MRALRRQARQQDVLDHIAAFKNVQMAPRVVRINAGHMRKQLIVTHESFDGRHYIGPLEDWKSIACGDLPNPNRDKPMKQRYSKALTIPSKFFAQEATLRLSQVPAEHLSTVVTELCLLPRSLVPDELVEALGRRLFFNRELLSVRALGLAVELNSAPQEQIRLLKQLANKLDAGDESLHTVNRLSNVVPRLALQPASRKLNEVLTKSLSSISTPLREQWAAYFVEFGMVDGPYAGFWEQLHQTDPHAVARYREHLPLHFDVCLDQAVENLGSCSEIPDEWALSAPSQLSVAETQTLILRSLGQEPPARRVPIVRPALWQASPESYRRHMVAIPAKQLCSMLLECTKDLAGLRPQAAQQSCGRKKGLTPMRPRVGHGDRERARTYVRALVEVVGQKSMDFWEAQACSTISSLGRLVDEGLLDENAEELALTLEALTYQLVKTRNLENLRPVDVIRLCEGMSVLHGCLPYDVRPNLARFLAWMLRTIKDCPQSMLLRLLNVVRRMDFATHRVHTILALKLLSLKLAPERTRQLAVPLVRHLPKPLQKRLMLQLT